MLNFAHGTHNRHHSYTNKIVRDWIDTCNVSKSPIKLVGNASGECYQEVSEGVDAVCSSASNTSLYQKGI